MFLETLLESSPAARKRKRWPMLTAFTLELTAAAVLILIPLFSTGIIPIFARVPQPALHVVRVADKTPVKPAGGATTGGTRGSAARFVEVAAIGNQINYPPQTDIGPANEPTYIIGNCTSNCLPDGPPTGGNSSRPQPGPATPGRISVLSEGRLLHRVEPVYPHPATVIHLQGVVKLHALIAKDGTVQSLNVISGHPLLAAAAIDAVQQWRYRPYILNGEPVEVETFITVTFKRNGD
ncbi:MAG: energy transducer TonB [Acidobacteriia bacterium]|nr:energy transducer TonB [Terriglobia bacterium]